MIIFVAIVALLSLAPTPSPNPYPNPDPDPIPTRNGEARIVVRCDPRVELFATIFRIAGDDAYTMPNSRSPYSDAVDAWFTPYAGHEAVKLARKLREEQGISWNAVPDLAVHVNDVKDLEPKVPLDPFPERLDRRWTAESATAFLAAARDFARDTRFLEFFAKQEPFCTEAARRLQKQIADARIERWVAEFFGPASKGASFTVIPGLLNGGGSYGCGVVLADGTLELSPVMGCWTWDAKGLPVFGQGEVPTVAHEFAHNFANPIIERHSEELEEAGHRLFLFAENNMRAQGYANGKIVLCESLVRASVIRYLAKQRGNVAMEAGIKDEESSGFLWIRDLAELLATYEEHRERYPTLEAFADELISFFIDRADALPDVSQARPKVLEMMPANGDDRVDPELAEIRIRFDRKMRDRSWGLIGNPAETPKARGAPRYDETRTVYTLPVQLERNKRYHFFLNAGDRTLFRSEEGAGLEPVEVTFKTRE
jgi:hypothetical protein